MKNKINVYELLGLIKDGKAPHSIFFKNEVWFWGYDTYTTFECLNKTPDSQISLFNKYRIDYCLNDIVEIIDNVENKPIIEKISISGKDIHKLEELGIYDIVENIDCKLNEIIEFLNRKEDK